MKPQDAGAQLRASARTYRLLFDDNPQPMWIYDHETLAFLAVNDAAVARYGYSRDEFFAMTIADMRPAEDVPALRRSVRNGVTVDRSGPWRHRTKGGELIDVEITSHVLPYGDRPARFVMAHDITDRQRYEQQLRHRALHDDLTGLPNRALALDRLAHALPQAQRDARVVGVLAIDVDRFKLVNEGHGHEAGDEILCALSQRLQAAIRPADTLGRVGGDEFVLVCVGLGSEAEAVALAERIELSLREPFATGDGETFLTTSVGIVLSRGEGRPEELLRDAGAAMHRAKEHGGACYELYDDAIRARTLARLDTETALRRAVARGELRLHYQPELDLRTGGCTGVEALVRWQHPSRGLLPPLEFIPVAEETGLVVPLGRWVLREACRQGAAWKAAGGPPTVSVNLSARQLAAPSLTAQVGEALDATGLEPERLCLEITETALLDDAEVALVVLDALHGLGVRLSIDDFGTGYSSLLYLKRYPVDFVKIDRVFVSGLGVSAQDDAIVRAVIDLAHAVGVSVVAEGVETEAQASALRAMGCDLGQGFLWSRPVEAAALAPAHERTSR